MHKLYGYGHWEVAGRLYHNKFKAFEDAFSIGHLPHWNFYEENFGQHDWSSEPAESLEQLYAQRALDIRQNHDYVIVMFSGGCDSWTVVDSFIRSGAGVDEIWSLAGHTWCDPNDRSTHAGNLANEPRFAAIPHAKKFLSRDPRIKFRVLDATELIEEYWRKNSPDPLDEHWISPEGPVREIIERYDGREVPKTSTNRVVRIVGVDKPTVLYIDGQFYMRFFDISILARSSMRRTVLTDSTDYDMAFYWHPDSAKIIIKQGHVIKRWFKDHPQYLGLLKDGIGTPERRLLQQTVNRLIYPHYDFGTWQADKDWGGAFDNKVYLPFTSNDSSTAASNWRSTVKSFSDAVYQLFEKNSRLTEHTGAITKNDWYYNLPGCYSKLYCIGS